MSDPFSKHPIVTETQDLKSLCKSLETLNIHYFAHVFIDRENTFSGLNNNPEFFKHYIKNHYHNADIHNAQNKLGKYILWDSLERRGLSQKMHEEAKAFGIQHTFTIVNKTHEGNHFYHFANSQSPLSINQTYLTHLDLLELFIEHFKHEVQESSTLSSAYDFRYKINNETAKYETLIELPLILNEKERLKFIDDLKISNAEIAQIEKDLKKITAREKQVLEHYIRGKTAREIGLLLNLSRRTVEQHLAKIKEKLNVQKKSMLIEVLFDRFSAKNTTGTY